VKKLPNKSLGSVSRDISKLSVSIESKLNEILVLNSAYSYMKKRGQEIYTQVCHKGTLINQVDTDELVDAFTKMEQAHLENDILSFGLYAYKQIESLTNNLINNTPILTIEQDLVEPNGYKTMLLHRIYSFYNSTTTGRNYDKEVVDFYKSTGQLPSLEKGTFSNKIKYFIWHFDFKLTLDKNKVSNKSKFYLVEIPYQYLKAARNRIHGGSINTVSSYDLSRITEIEANKGKFFLMFSTILYDFHKRFFSYA